MPQPPPPTGPAAFTTEEEFLRYFQEELAQQQVVAEPAIEKLQAIETMAQAAPLPLQTEEDFLRLFKVEMDSAPALSLEAPAPIIAAGPPVPMQTEEDFLRQFQADMALVAEPPEVPPMIEVPVAPPEPEPGTIFAAAVERTLAAAELPPEQVMAQNAAWLLGLEPLPMIQFDDSPLTQLMPAEIPDSVEISDAPPLMQRPSSHGLLGQMLEQEPVTMVNEVPVEAPVVEKLPLVQAAKEPEIMVPGWLHAGMSMESKPMSPDALVKVREPETSLIRPRRIVPRAPVTVPVDGDSKRWLNWWK